MENLEIIREILIDLGYSLKDCGKNYRTKPVYRDSDNDTVLSIDKNTGLWYDFRDNKGGNFEELISLSKKVNLYEAKKILKERNYLLVSSNDSEENQDSVIDIPKIYDKAMLSKLEKNHFYWRKRGVSEFNIEKFEGGVALDGRMSYRYVFPIFNHKKEIIGFCGRSLINSDRRPKWKIIGPKKEFCYPAFLSKNEINKSKEVYLVESIGDMLSLFEAGIYNVLVTFGTTISPKIIKFLIQIKAEKIFVSLNNDEQSQVGNRAAYKMANDLMLYFDESKIQVSLPSKKDFGEMNPEEIQLWIKNTSQFLPQE